MIKDFGDIETEKIWNGVFSKKLPYEIQNIARRKLRMINNAKIKEHTSRGNIRTRISNTYGHYSI